MTTEVHESVAGPDNRPPLYGWLIVVLAALAMVATLPGRTHGLGMITERLLNDPSLGIDRATFGDLNLWATLAGAFFCFPCGWMIDRWGLRASLTAVVALLGIVVIAMTHAAGVMQFAILLLLTRGFGQSALSVISISMVGKWFRPPNLALATGLYSAFVSIGFIGAFLWGRGLSHLDWRMQWQWQGQILLFALAPLFLLLVRAPASKHSGCAAEAAEAASDFTLAGALTTPAFWLFALATSLYGLVSSGVSLFNESLLVERGFSKNAFYDLSMLTTGVGLAANFVTGFLASQIRITWLASLAMGILAGALLGLPFVATYPALVTYAIAMGCAGGMITVLFFAVWARLYGRTHLGRIQGVAQMLTVVASALGPKILAEVKVAAGSYLPAIVTLGLVALGLAILAAVAPIPRRRDIPDIASLVPAVTN